MAAFDTSRCRILHTMLRVFDYDRALSFYCGIMGMTLIWERQAEDGGRRFAFVGYDDENTGTVIELIWDAAQAEPYSHGSGYGHIAIAVQNVQEACDRLAAQGVKIVRQPFRPPHGRFTIAFIEDADGYQVELIERR